MAGHKWGTIDGTAARAETASKHRRRQRRRRRRRRRHNGIVSHSQQQGQLCTFLTSSLIHIAFFFSFSESTPIHGNQSIRSVYRAMRALRLPPSIHPPNATRHARQTLRTASVAPLASSVDVSSSLTEVCIFGFDGLFFFCFLRVFLYIICDEIFWQIAGFFFFLLRNNSPWVCSFTGLRASQTSHNQFLRLLHTAHITFHTAGSSSHDQPLLKSIEYTALYACVAVYVSVVYVTIIVCFTQLVR